MKVVKSTATSATSHIVVEGQLAKGADLVMACGAKLKRTHNTSIKQQGQVTCVPCVTAYVAGKRS